MEAVRSLLTVIWNWISTNRDALILEAISVGFTLCVVNLLLKRYERRRWSPMRKQVALEIGWAIQRGLMRIMAVSGLGLAHVVSLNGWDSTTDIFTYIYRTMGRFFEHEYERDFEAKYLDKVRQQSRAEWIEFSRNMDYTLGDLDRCIPLARGLFEPEVMSALMELRKGLYWAQVLMFEWDRELVPSEDDFEWVKGLASNMGRVLTLIWAEVD